MTEQGTNLGLQASEAIPHFLGSALTWTAGDAWIHTQGHPGTPTLEGLPSIHADRQTEPGSGPTLFPTAGWNTDKYKLRETRYNPGNWSPHDKKKKEKSPSPKFLYTVPHKPHCPRRPTWPLRLYPKPLIFLLPFPIILPPHAQPVGQQLLGILTQQFKSSLSQVLCHRPS